MAKTRVPSQYASGKETFNDNLIGFQITDGSSQLTNTVFDFDKTTPQKEDKYIETQSFSEFLSLDTLQELSPNYNDFEKNKEIKFKLNKDDANDSLYGSLSVKISEAITSIIQKFPAAFLSDPDITYGSSYTAENISYNSTTNVTIVDVNLSKIFICDANVYILSKLLRP